MNFSNCVLKQRFCAQNWSSKHESMVSSMKYSVAVRNTSASFDPLSVCNCLFIAEARACTGSLAVHPRSRDVKIANFSITFYGSEMLQDTLLELNCGRRYGVIGLNGCGKSSLLACLGNREVGRVYCFY